MLPEHRNFALMPMCSVKGKGTYPRVYWAKLAPIGEKATVFLQPWLKRSGLDSVVMSAIT